MAAIQPYARQSILWALLHFLFRRDKGLLINRPFSNWVKLNNVLSNHSKPAHHREAVPSTVMLKTTVENPASRVCDD